MQCRRWQQCGHTLKWCKAEQATCGKCATDGHLSQFCLVSSFKCCHCGENHAARNLKCKENIFQSEITQLMTRAKIQRRDATEIVRSRYPDHTRSYVAVTSTQPRSPLQTTVNLGNTFLVMKPLLSSSSNERMRWKRSWGDPSKHWGPDTPARQEWYQHRRWWLQPRENGGCMPKPKKWKNLHNIN